MVMSKSIKISGKILARYNEIISDNALQFVQEIHEKFNSKRLELLNERNKRQKDIDGYYVITDNYTLYYNRNEQFLRMEALGEVAQPLAQPTLVDV